MKEMHGSDLDPDTDHIVICCGQSVAFAAAMFAIIDQIDEVILFYPSYETYDTCNIKLAEGFPACVALDPPYWTLNPHKLEKIFTDKTTALVLNMSTRRVLTAKFYGERVVYGVGAANGGGDAHRLPLLQHVQTYHSTPLPVEELPPSNSANSKQRLVSLDVFRGLTVALMILVDDAGKAFPSINHAPWFGVTLADFVMPFFLFVVGVSVSLVFKKVTNRSAATKKVIIRTVWLFLLGVILQGGYFHGRSHLTYGVDLEKIRLMGVLQRIAIGYLLASILEIWLVKNTEVDSTVAFMERYSFQMGAAILLGLLYMLLLYGLYVPNWTFDMSGLSINLLTSPGSNTPTVQCGLRGSLEPPCNAVGLIDRILLGEQHLYQRPVYRRTKECSVNSPDYGPLPPNSPAWCLAPFDPEGILSSLMAAITCFVGLHYGHIIVHFKGQMQRIIIWSISSLLLLISCFLVWFLGVPFSKPLYTLSYMFISAAASGFLFSVIYFIVDCKGINKPTVIFQWMGLNALIIYALAACDIFPAFLQGFYWRSPESNLVGFSERVLQTLFHSNKWGTLVFVVLEILFWGAVAGFLHWKRIYIKL